MVAAMLYTNSWCGTEKLFGLFWELVANNAQGIENILCCSFGKCGVGVKVKLRNFVDKRGFAKRLC